MIDTPRWQLQKPLPPDYVFAGREAGFDVYVGPAYFYLVFRDGTRRLYNYHMAYEVTPDLQEKMRAIRMMEFGNG